MAKKTEPSKYAAALQYLQQMRDRAADFGGGVVDTLGNRARDVGGLAYEALTSDPNISRMNTAEFSQAAADRPSTPRLDAAVQGIGEMGKALVTQPVQTAKAIVVDPVVDAFESPRAMGQFAGEFVNPLRIAAALRKTAPIAELDVYHGTPHRFPGTEENPLGEFDASKIGTGEGAQSYGHGVYLAENPEIARSYQNKLQRQGKTDLSGQLDLMMERLLPKTQSGYEVKGIIYPYQKELIDGIAQGLIKQGDIPNDLYSAAKSYTEPGSLYKADLPDDMIDRMLDWDKPLSEQSYILKSISKNKDFVQYAERIMERPLSELDGKTLERIAVGYAVDKGAKGSQNAAKLLKEAGIPGIRYLDAGSRDGGSGTRNFVVFPGEEKKVKILERDGQKAPPQKIAQALEAAPDYRMGHRPMTVEGGAARLDNAYEAFGEDIYGPNALRYFGGSDPRESGTVAALKRLRNNPDAEVTIYRGVPTDAKGGITKGDWVTLDKSAAQEYAELKPGQKGKVLAMKVKAKDVTTWPDSLLEFGYYPAD